MPPPPASTPHFLDATRSASLAPGASMPASPLATASRPTSVFVAPSMIAYTERNWTMIASEADENSPSA